MSIHALAWGWIDTGAEEIPALWVLPEAALLASCLGTGLVWEGSGQPPQRSLDLRPVACRRLLLAWNFLMIFAVCEVEAVTQLPSEIQASSRVSCRLPLPAPG